MSQIWVNGTRNAEDIPWTALTSERSKILKSSISEPQNSNLHQKKANFFQ
jgi:hypothetical protein